MTCFGKGTACRCAWCGCEKSIVGVSCGGLLDCYRIQDTENTNFSIFPDAVTFW